MSSVLAAMEGGWREVSLYFCSCKAVFGSRVLRRQPGAWFKQLGQLTWLPDHLESAVSLSEPPFLSWVTEWSWEWGGRWWVLNSLTLQQAFWKKALNHPFSLSLPAAPSSPPAHSPGGWWQWEPGSREMGTISSLPLHHFIIIPWLSSSCPMLSLF